MQFWQDAANDESSILSRHAKTLLAEVNKRPDLLEPDISAETLKRHDDLVPYLMTPLIPLGGSKKLYARRDTSVQTGAVFRHRVFR